MWGAIFGRRDCAVVCRCHRRLLADVGVGVAVAVVVVVVDQMCHLWFNADYVAHNYLAFGKAAIDKACKVDSRALREER